MLVFPYSDLLITHREKYFLESLLKLISRERDRNFLNQLHDEKNITKLHNMYENTNTNELYLFLLLLISETLPHSTSILLATVNPSHAAVSQSLLGSSVTQDKNLSSLLN